MDNSVSMTLTVSPELNEKLLNFAQHNGTGLDQVLLKALTLYEVAYEAKHDNKRLGILDSDQNIVAEVVGI